MFNNNNMKPHILYKVNVNDNCLIFLNMVRYLYTRGFDIRADNIIEINFPKT